MTIDDWRARYDGLNAEAERLKAEAADLRKRLDVALFLVDALRAQVTPEVISEKHKDGSLWLVWSPALRVWVKGRWRFWCWMGTNGTEICDTPAYALPLPPAPEVTNDSQ